MRYDSAEALSARDTHRVYLTGETERLARVASEAIRMGARHAVALSLLDQGIGPERLRVDDSGFFRRLAPDVVALLQKHLAGDTDGTDTTGG